MKVSLWQVVHIWMVMLFLAALAPVAVFTLVVAGILESAGLAFIGSALLSGQIYAAMLLGGQCQKWEDGN